MSDSKKQIFFLTHAGGSADFFRGLIADLGDEYECCPFEYPGHGSRFGETFLQSVSETAEQFSEYVKARRTDAGYYLFAYSMGCIVAVDAIARFLQSDLPEKVFFASHVAPHVMSFAEDPRQLSDDRFIDLYIRPLGGVDENLKNNRVYRRVYLPVLRHDYCILSEYHWNGSLPVMDSELHVLYSPEDVHCRRMDEWTGYTSSDNVSFRQFSGGHFFLRSHAAEVSGIIKNV